MAQCKLSDRQRDLLRLIVEGLRTRARTGDHPPRQFWIRLTHDHSRPTWQDVTDPDLKQRLQDGTELGDIVMFEKCGFIENGESGRYYLLEARIIDAVERDFTVSHHNRNYMKQPDQRRRARGRRSQDSKN